MNTYKKYIVCKIAIIAVSLLVAQTSEAQTTYTWTQAAGGTQLWSNASNWSGGVVPDPVAGDTITMNMAMAAATYLELGADRTFETWFGQYHGFDSRSFNINSGYAITLAGTTPTIEVTSGALTLNNILSGTGGFIKRGIGALVLNNAGNDFSGGIELAAGSLTAGSDAAFGDVSNDITISGNVTFSLANNISYTRDFILNNGTTLQFSDILTRTLSGTFTGLGGIRISASGHGHQDVTFSSTSNTFTGALRLGQGDTGVTAKFNSFADSVNPIELLIGIKGDTTFVWSPGAVAPLVLDSRQIVLSGGGNKNHVIENANSNHTITVNTDFIVTRTSAQPLVLQGVNTGENTISGVISNGTSSVTSVQKSGSGTWVLSGVNTYTGSTTVSGGILKLAASECLADAGTLTINGGKLELAAGVGERIDNLILGSITQTTNTSYGSFSSSAEIRNDTYFSGPGLLFLGMDPPPAGTVIIVR